MILYNCHHSGDQYRITKFNDGNIESSYLTTHSECDCPAGFRPTCRHRQMLPQMLADGIINTHWFLEWDNKGGVVDIFGTPKTTIDKLLEPIVPAGQHTAAEPELTGLQEELILMGFHQPELCGQIEPTSELCQDEGCPQSAIEHVCVTSPSPKPWRRF